MFGKRKRPWKKFAKIERKEMNSGDVKFIASSTRHMPGVVPLGVFESLTEAEAHLDKWYAEWWPKQVKRTSRA